MSWQRSAFNEVNDLAPRLGGSRRNPNLPQMEFVENQVKSSRYTILTFLPKLVIIL